MIQGALVPCWLALVLPQAATAGEVVLAPRAEITRAEIEAHVRFLASDELRGRATGTPEAERAARYLARVLELSGLEPAGDGGTFLQAVPLERPQPARGELVLTTRSGELVRLEAGRDFEPPAFDVALAGLALVTVGEQGELPKAGLETALFVDLPSTPRRRRLEAAGHPEGRGFGLVLVPGSSRARPEQGARRAASPRPVRDPRTAVPSIRVHGEALERLRAGEFTHAAVETTTPREPVSAWNVVGRIRGAGRDGQSDLARQGVVFSAHYDHLPDVAHVGSADGGSARAARTVGASGEAERTASAAEGEAALEVDLIHNGADDDASGCAAVLELAGAFAAGPKPARTLVFLLVTGEEIGLLGTRHYLDQPVVPLEHTVANLNYEMVGRPDELVGGPGRMWLTGWERTNLGAAFAERGLAIVADPRPSERFFERSDNYAFVLRGIVGQTFSSYNLHADYHRPSDEVERIDFAHMETAVRSAFEAARPVASGELTPAWMPDGRPAAR